MKFYSFRSTKIDVMKFLWVLCFAQLGLLSGCTSTIIDVQDDNAVYPSNWVILPFQNASGTPLAGKRIVPVLATLLRNLGVTNLKVLKSENKAENWLEFDDSQQEASALEWARKNKFDYAVTGVIEEWRYKSGVGGEAAVGLSFQIIDISTEEVIWSATGARSGWGRETLRGVAQKLLNNLLSNLELSGIEK